MNLLSKPKPAVGYQHDGTLSSATGLLDWLQSQGYLFSAQSLNFIQKDKVWEVSITYFKPPNQPNGAPQFIAGSFAKGFCVVTEQEIQVRKYATAEALAVDFDQNESV